jgi:hypothetical protein
MSGKDKAELVDQTGRNSLDPKSAPIPLPAGSYDIEALNKGFGAVSRASAENRDKAIEEALNSAKAEGTVLDAVDPAAQPDYVTVELAHPVLEGVTENVRVYEAPKGEAAAAKPETTKE